MKLKTNILNRTLRVLMVCVTIISTLFTSSIPTFASSLSLDEPTNYYYTGISPNTGYSMTHNIYVLKMDGQKVFCIESGVPANSGEGYTPETYINAKKDKLSKIAYYGYTVTNQSHYDYAVTQAMIWEELGDQRQSTTIPNYDQRKAEIMALVNRHDTLPSWNGQTVTVKVGDSVTLTDSNNVIADMSLDSNSTNATVKQNGNTLVITPSKNSKNGSITYRKVPQNKIGTSIVYRKPNEQSMVEFHLESAKQASVKVSVIKLGNLQATKIDEETGNPLANAKLKFEYSGTSKEVVTDSNGVATIKNIPEGTTVTVSEVTAPNGYVNKGEMKKVTIKSNETITVTLSNKEQLGQVQLEKSGKDFGTSMPNKYYSLGGAVYDIYQADGTKISTMTTDTNGKATSVPLKLGNYYALETKAPAGYQLNKEKIPFELNYTGQIVEITSTSITQVEVEQKGNMTLIKEDAKTGTKAQGAATLDGAVYELRRTADDQLIKEVTIKDGTAIVSGINLDDYYWIETQAPEGYLKDTEKHPLQLKYAGQTVETAVQSTTVKETVITGGFDLVKFGNYDWLTHGFGDKKMKPLEKVEFSVYSDTTGKLVQKGLTDKEGYLKFAELPYDTYTVKETKTPEGYKATADFKVTIREQNETPHYAIENKVIEEKLKVVKVDAETGKVIPRTDAGFQIKNLQTGELVSMPKFNEDGKTDTFFTNKAGYLLLPQTLSYGDYELIEVQAPEGYVLAKEPRTFTVDGSHKDGLIEIRFKDHSQKGMVNFTKTGQTPIGVEVKESDYGQVYEFQYDYTPIAGVTYRIEAIEDITTNDGTVRAKKGEVVATLTTDEQGTWQSPELYLGKYQAVEAAAPNGFIVDPTPIPFELKYAGQLVELTSTSLTATNDFQSLDIQLFKDEESITDWNDNQPKLENIKGNDKVFGLFTRDEQSMSEDLQVPVNALVSYQMVKDGIAVFDLKLPEGKYYLKELDAGTRHVTNDTEFEIEFTAENNQATYPIHVYDNTVIYGEDTVEKTGKPIVNKLHFNAFTLKKVNEHANFDKEHRLSFTYDTLGTGAIFTLETEDGEVMQEVAIDKDGLGIFETIPVGTFYLKEKAPSSDKLILSKDVIRIESTRDGIKAYDKGNQLLDKSPAPSEEIEEPILFELTNYLKKGTAELTKKDVSTGEILSNTGIRILNDKKEVIVEGRTNEKGLFTFEQLPIGTYYFQEFDAPDGYRLDETPLKFEIKEDGKVVKCEMTNQKLETPKRTDRFPNTGATMNKNLLIIGFVAVTSALGLFYARKKKKQNN
ncbi:SpaA isopeptide-forming pilin-related protein [Enterococcus gallinarum]|uniref:SpaA isopeptide-forming pilin-related protein n=1 Tax=Enterococcus gallinarum TaxID=1353 RepID=UPI0022E72A1A|nr:SpaA isopeptide-forming pilin-related protein [Enterococcus gallinarum]